MRSRKHFGARVALSYLFAVLVCLAAMTVAIGYGANDDVSSNIGSLVLGLSLWGFAHWWLHLRLFQKPVHVLAGTIACVAIVLTNFLPPQPLPTFTWTRLIGTLATGICVGVGEELCFRGPLLWWLVARTPKRLNRYWFAAIVSAVLFGAAHLANLSLQPDVVQILIQVGYAAAMGFAAAAIVFYTHHLGFTIAMHAAFDAVAGYWDSSLVSQVGFDALSIASLAVMVIVELVIGVLFLHKLTKGDQHG